VVKIRRDILPAGPDVTELPDAIDTLIQRCLAGDQDAWADIVRQYRRRIYSVAYKFTGNHEEAEDLTQDIFIKVFRALHTFDRRANFQTWLISVSRNMCIDHYRSVRKERETINRDIDADDLMPVADGLAADALLEQQRQAALLRRALAALPEPLKTAVTLRDLQDLSYQEIARRLQVPEGTVKSRINRGRAELVRLVRQFRHDLEGART
jgi:RNA polymerase sigma-70 factor (ECF subfamily)